MNNQSIKVEKCIKYLGVWLDFRLSWDIHIKYIAKRTSLIFHAFSQIARKGWGLNSEGLSVIYDHIYVPIITYGCLCWGDAAQKVHLHRKLISSQRKALLLITRAYRTAPNSSLQVISRKPFITEIIRMERSIWSLKNGNDISTPSCNIQACNYEYLSPYTQAIPPHINNLIGNSPPLNPDLVIYTDGSGHNNSIGCAFVAYCNNMEIYSQQNRLHNTCTAFQSEILAINMAINWIEQRYTENSIHIITDSSSAIELICGTKLHPIATSIRHLILHSSNSYHITWTRGHQNTEGNKRADQLAKAAAVDDSLTIIYNKISHDRVRKIMYKDVLSRWQSSWSQRHNEP
ncbi:uncharacterized protein LOC111637486 [Centruroides sculpturatus]|uniref:uncharacterized protein LOC111637486 n=1 Tax=Centruroides sculpturatus TaxID=218467 RepID=UPI000C6CE71C|nr:uncharacterized protein LOC111637486 [Centruroides sculpturatus]